MEYAQVRLDGSTADQIYEHGNVEWDETHLCPASALTPEEASIFRVVPLTPVAPPEFNPMTQFCSRDGCELVDGKWQYKWAVTDMTLEQIETKKEEYRLSLIPALLTRRQFKIALIRAGLFETVETIVNSSTDLELKITYQEALEFERNHPMVVMMASAMGKTEREIDDLFTLGATL